MEKNTKKEAIKKIISEEIVRFEKIKTLQAKKKQLSEALTLLEEGKLEEWSFKGIGNALGFTGKKAGEAATGVGNAVANKANSVNQKINKGIHSVGKSIGNKAAAVADSASQFQKGLSNAMTAGDIQALEGNLVKMFEKLHILVKELNQKQVKLGVKPTSLKSILFKAANQVKKTPAIAESVTEKKK